MKHSAKKMRVRLFLVCMAAAMAAVECADINNALSVILTRLGQSLL